MEFSHDGFDVTVTASGEVTVRPSGEGSRDGVPTKSAFQDELSRLVWEADANGVDVIGGWASLDGSGTRGLDIEIVELRLTPGASEARSFE